MKQYTSENGRQQKIMNITENKLEQTETQNIPFTLVSQKGHLHGHVYPKAAILTFSGAEKKFMAILEINSNM